jgi:hypothetical protein
MKMYTFSENELTGLINDGIERYVAGMIEQGVLAEEKSEELKNYRIVIIRRGMLGKLIDKVMDWKSEDTLRYQLVKLI